MTLPRMAEWCPGILPAAAPAQLRAAYAETGRRTVDKLAEIWRQDNQEAWVLVHVEVQTQPEAAFVSIDTRSEEVQNQYLFDFNGFC